MRITRVRMATGVVCVFVGAFVGSFVVAGAGIPDGNRNIKTCYTLDGGVDRGRVRVIDYDAGIRCRANERALDWAAGASAPSSGSDHIDLGVDGAKACALDGWTYGSALDECNLDVERATWTPIDRSRYPADATVTLRLDVAYANASDGNLAGCVRIVDVVEQRPASRDYCFSAANTAGRAFPIRLVADDVVLPRERRQYAVQLQGTGSQPYGWTVTAAELGVEW